MFKNKNIDGSNNISGKRIAEFRKKKKLSQRALAAEMQLIGLDISKNTVQQIESGERFVTDLELAYFSYYFKRPIGGMIEFGDKYIQDVSLIKVAEEDEKL